MSLTVAVTNDPDGALAASADVGAPASRRGRGGRRRLPHLPGDARACSSWSRQRLTTGSPAVGDLEPAIAAAAALRETATTWLPELVERIAGAHTTYTIAPAERLSSALQSALMLREGPRLPADATETGDWLHIDVYLSKRPGYTALLFPGSRYDDGVMGYARERESAIVAVGRSLDGAALSIPIPGVGRPSRRAAGGDRASRSSRRGALAARDRRREIRPSADRLTATSQDGVRSH